MQHRHLLFAFGVHELLEEPLAGGQTAGQSLGPHFIVLRLRPQHELRKFQLPVSLRQSGSFVHINVSPDHAEKILALRHKTTKLHAAVLRPHSLKLTTWTFRVRPHRHRHLLVLEELGSRWAVPLINWWQRVSNSQRSSCFNIKLLVDDAFG